MCKQWFCITWIILGKVTWKILQHSTSNIKINLFFQIVSQKSYVTCQNYSQISCFCSNMCKQCFCITWITLGKVTWKILQHSTFEYKSQFIFSNWKSEKLRDVSKLLSNFLFLLKYVQTMILHHLNNIR